MTNTTLLWTIIVLAAVVLIVSAIVSRRRARMRSDELRRRFGPEYDRAVQATGSPTRAERELAARARRVERFRFQDLSEADRSRFASAWNRIQGQFVDDPARAVVAANDLIKEVMVARGYPADGFDQRVADLSVGHPDVVQHYRAARALSDSSRKGSLNTEELRQAVVHYRVMFADLLEERGPVPDTYREGPEPMAGRDEPPHIPHH